MPELTPQSTPLLLDLTRYAEHTRRELYDRLVRIQFGPKPPDPEDPPLSYTPDEAELTVFYVFGRWFATWKVLEEPVDLPDSRRVELVRIQAAPDSPDGIILYEV